jgi:hypothetical protein
LKARHMALVHAYRRDAPHQVDFGAIKFDFAANDAGHQVCEVPDGPELARLLEITEGYVRYGDVPDEPSAAEDDDAMASKFIITSGDDDQAVDLRKLDRAGLLAFIEEQELDYKPHHRAGDDTIRHKIVELLIGG